MWKTLSTKHPQVLAGSSNKYQNWENQTLRSGCLMGICVYAWTHAERAARPGISISFLRSHITRYDAIQTVVNWYFGERREMAFGSLRRFRTPWN